MSFSGWPFFGSPVLKEVELEDDEDEDEEEEEMLSQEEPADAAEPRGLMKRHEQTRSMVCTMG